MEYKITIFHLIEDENWTIEIYAKLNLDINFIANLLLSLVSSYHSL